LLDNKDAKISCIDILMIFIPIGRKNGISGHSNNKISIDRGYSAYGFHKIDDDNDT
jgi:hypothetical protein